MTEILKRVGPAFWPRIHTNEHKCNSYVFVFIRVHPWLILFSGLRTTPREPL
jgi:hypothetical protein